MYERCEVKLYLLICLLNNVEELCLNGPDALQFLPSVTKEMAPRQPHSGTMRFDALEVHAPAHTCVHMHTCTHTWLCPLYPEIFIPCWAKKPTLRLWSSSKYKPHFAKGSCRVTTAFHSKETISRHSCQSLFLSLFFLISSEILKFYLFH